LPKSFPPVSESIFLTLVLGCRFIITDADEYVYKYLEGNAAAFPSETLDTFRHKAQERKTKLVQESLTAQQEKLEQTTGSVLFCDPEPAAMETSVAMVPLECTQFLDSRPSESPSKRDIVPPQSQGNIQMLQNQGDICPPLFQGNIPTPQNQGDISVLQSQGGIYPPQSQGGIYPPQSQGGICPPQSQGGICPPQSQGGICPPQSQGGIYPPQSQGGIYPPQSQGGICPPL
ncbi:hypothetical protein scyTo_0023875, partial [Scyliorhinus torazame]|nr:hypothetical protein [Scyliorhinus torazame]